MRMIFTVAAVFSFAVFLNAAGVLAELTTLDGKTYKQVKVVKDKVIVFGLFLEFLIKRLEKYSLLDSMVIMRVIISFQIILFLVHIIISIFIKIMLV